MGLFHPKKGMKGQKMIQKPRKMWMGSTQVLPMAIPGRTLHPRETPDCAWGLRIWPHDHGLAALAGHKLYLHLRLRLPCCNRFSFCSVCMRKAPFKGYKNDFGG